MMLLKRPKTGASQLQLDNTELRRELVHAHAIISNIEGIIIEEQRDMLVMMNALNAYTTSDDPFRSQARRCAMHRIKPRHDYNKWALMLLVIVLSIAWGSVARTNQQLQQTHVLTHGDSRHDYDNR